MKNKKLILIPAAVAVWNFLGGAPHHYVDDSHPASPASMVSQ